MNLKEFFKLEAEKLLTLIQEQHVTVADIASGLQCVYYAGVLDHDIHTQDQKEKMMRVITEAYKLPTERQ